MTRLVRALPLLASAALASAALSSAGCATSTPRPLPERTVPEAWEASTATVSTSTLTTAWWRTFGDPALTRLVEEGTPRNLDLRIADARIQEARGAVGAAAAELWPSLGASVGAGVGRNDGVTRASFTAGLSASWEVDVFGRLRDEERAAAAAATAFEGDRDAVRLVMQAEIAATYVEYRLRRAQYALALRTAEAQEGTVRITRARFEQGIASRFDLERALAALALTRSRIPEAEELALTARYRLALLLADSPQAVGAVIGAEDRPLPAGDPVTVLASPAAVITKRPDVTAAEWRLRAAVAQVDAAEALRYPTLDLSGALGLDSATLGNLFDPLSVVWSLGAGLAAPLLDFGRIRAQIDQADARQEQAYLRWEQVVRTALQEAQTAVVSYTHGVTRQQELEKALESARKAAAFARLQYREGTVSLLEVLDAERSLDEAELSWSQATADVALRVIQIHRTMGG